MPVGLFTWEYDYLWKTADLKPWELACGSVEMWHQAHLSIFKRHQPNLIWYSKSGTGDKPPTLKGEDMKCWYIKDNNTQIYCIMTKDSFALIQADTGGKNCDPVGVIDSKADAIRLIPEFDSWGESYLNGLSRLISEVQNKALILPHHSPAYICSCYAFGFERAMEKMILDPKLFIYVCDRFASGDERRMQELAGAGAEAVFIADSWASCDILSPEMIQRFAIPYQKSMIDAAHKAGLRIILWNEGNILPILDLESELDMDAFAFEQSRKGVDIQVSIVQKAFGRHRCLLGNLDSELMLLRNDSGEIREQVIDNIRQSGKGCPFILSTGSPISNDVSPEAVDIMIRVAREFKWDI